MVHMSGTITNKRPGSGIEELVFFRSYAFMKLTSVFTIAFTTIPSQVFHAGMNATDFLNVFLHCEPACLEKALLAISCW